MSRRSIPINAARDLWAQCGGFCQNPSCNRPLFATIGNTPVSLANVAHIVGRGGKGPRSDHELADVINTDGIDNLIMLCLICHKIVDQLERDFTVEVMQTWKRKHATRIANLFQIQTILDENVLLEEISSLLDIDEAIFGDCGPFSESVINGTSGDGLLLWRNRCLDTILPNNQRIVQLIDSNRRHFPYQWDVYDQMIAYKVHVDAFQDNCLTGRKINDYKTFPVGFNNFVKGKLGRQVIKHEKLRDDKVDYRPRQISKIIDLLSIHQLIHRMSHINLATMLVELKGGKVLKVFVTTSYFFTDYTFDRIMEIDPSVDTIINFHPAGSYTGSAKRLCIDNKIGLFTVGEFMGAIRQEGNDFLNYLLRSETSIRKRNISRMIKLSGPPPGRRFYVFGSYLRRKVYNDIDIMLVYQTATEVERLKDFVSSLVSEFEHDYETLDLTVASAEEFRSMKLEHDNLLQVYP